MMNIHFLKRAIDLSGEKMGAGIGGPFGAVIVKNGLIVAEGWNEVTSSNDPTAHAEVSAIRKAAMALNSFELKGCHIYSSCEPCPMCLAAIYWARIEKIFFANTRQEAAAIGFDDQYLYDEVNKPIKQRSIPTEHICVPEAKTIFKLWQEKADKVVY